VSCMKSVYFEVASDEDLPSIPLLLKKLGFVFSYAICLSVPCDRRTTAQNLLHTTL
jgi:hypothetical protein